MTATTPHQDALIEKVRETFDALLIAEVRAYGGIPVFAGRCGDEQAAFREAVAALLDQASTSVPPPSAQPCGCDPGCKPKPYVCEEHRV
jgi:hypothetical protein